MPQPAKIHPFEEYVCAHLARAIQAWDTRADIYAIGLHLTDVEDDFRRPMVRLIRNTRAHAQLHSPRQDEKADLPAACMRLEKKKRKAG